MDWVWNTPLYSQYAYHLLNSNCNNRGESSLQVGNQFPQSRISSTNVKHQQPHINPDNIASVNNLQIPTQSVVKQEPHTCLENVREMQMYNGQDIRLTNDNLNNEMPRNTPYNCNVKLEELEEETIVNEEPKVNTKDADMDMHVVKDQLSFKKKINNIYNYKIKSEYNPKVTIKKEKVSETHTNNENISDMHILKDQLNVQQILSNIQNPAVKLEEFETEEIVVNENDSNTTDRNSGKQECNQILCKKEYSALEVKQNLNNNYYLKHKKTKHLLDKYKHKTNQVQNTILQNEDKTTDAESDDKINITNVENAAEKAVENHNTAVFIMPHTTNYDIDDKIKTLLFANVKSHNWNCTLCEEKFSKKRDLKQHMLLHAETDVFTCSVCDYKTLRRNRLKVHMRMHTGERPFKCAECDFASTQQGNLKYHILRYHTKELKCTDCKMIFKGKINLNLHKKTAHSAKKRYACNVCDYRTNDSSALKCHSITHSGLKRYTCSDCNQSFRDKYGLKVHMLVHSGGKLLNCPECKYTTLEQRNLEKHVIMVHSTQNSAILISDEKKVCEHCGYACKTNSLFEKHMQIHVLHGKLLKCPNCAYQCKKHSTLREHSLMHKERVLRCKTCNYRFVSKDCYEAHMITHNEN